MGGLRCLLSARWMGTVMGDDRQQKWDEAMEMRMSMGRGMDLKRVIAHHAALAPTSAGSED
ncbi:hypothetical protein GCM10028787_31240 [Brachybacterium horti]